MTEVLRYKNEFLPHLARLFCPAAENLDAPMAYFRSQFAAYGEHCLLLKGESSLLAAARLVSLNSVQPGVVGVNLAWNSDLGGGQFQELLSETFAMARELVPQPALWVAATPVQAQFLSEWGFSVNRELTELTVDATQVPPAEEGDAGYRVVSMAENSDLWEQWIDVFNQGVGALWDQPPVDREQIDRVAKQPGFDPQGWRLGLAGDQPVNAIYYQGVGPKAARILAAATPFAQRSKGYGRRLLRNMLLYLGEKGFSQVSLATEAQNQATMLLFKMQGFKPAGELKVLECRTLPEDVPDMTLPLQPGGFYPLHSWGQAAGE